MGDEAVLRVEHSCDRVNFGSLERFFKTQRGEDGGETLGEHRLTRARGADHEDVVATSGCDLKRAFGDVLAANVFEIVGEMLHFVEKAGGIDAQGNGSDSSKCGRVEEVADFEEALDGIDVDALDDGGFSGIAGRDDEVADAAGLGGDGDGKHALDGAESAIEPQFAHKEEVGDFFDVKSTIGSKEADGDGQVEARTFFFEICGGEIDGDAGRWEVEAGVADGGGNTVAALAHRCVR